MAEAALLRREVATKLRGQSEAAAQELDQTVLRREQLTASVADLQRALSAQQAEDSTFSCALPHRHGQPSNISRFCVDDSIS